MIKVTQNSWLGGLLDAELMGRQDFDRYRMGASDMVNFLPQKRGSLAKRPGTELIRDITDDVGTTNYRLIPFGFTASEGAVLCITSNKMCVYTTDRQRYDVGGYSAYYKEAELGEICPAQCGDIIYLAHQNHPPAEVRHTGDGKYEFKTCNFEAATQSRPVIIHYEFKRQYFKTYTTPKEAGVSSSEQSYYAGVATVSYRPTSLDLDGNETALFDGADTAGAGDTDVENSTVIIASSSKDYEVDINGLTLKYYAPWTESQVVRIKVRIPTSDFKEVRLYKNVAGTYGLIGIAKKYQCTKEDGKDSYVFEFVDDNIAPDTSFSPLVDKKVFKAEGDYPAAVAVYQQRLVWASSKNDPARVWMSQTGDFYNYRPHEVLQADDAIDFILPITRFAKINFIVELRKLLMFSEACEWLVQSNSAAAGLSYDTIMATPHSYIGCDKRLPPVVANTSILFAERTGRAVRSYGYQLEDDGFGGDDISIFSSSIFRNAKIVDWTYQQHPQPTVWMVLEDGTLASMVYMPEQRICAWARHVLEGGGAEVKAKAIASTYALDDDTSEVFMAVKIGDKTKLVRLRKATAKALCLDFAEQSIASSSDSAEIEYFDIETGEKLDRASAISSAKEVLKGYPIKASVTSVYPALTSDTVGAAQFDKRVVHDVALRYIGGPGARVGVPADDQRVTLASNASVGKLTDERVVLFGCNNGDGRTVIEHDTQWPFEIVMTETDVEVEVSNEQ